MNTIAKNAVNRLLIVAICLLTACEIPTHVRIAGAANPIFVLSGSGRLACFVIYAADYAEKAESPRDENVALWKISAKEGNLNGRLWRLKRIVYGVVPEGYVQLKPQVGSYPPPLEGGKKYFFEVDTANAPGATGYVEIRRSQAVLTDGPYPCFGGEGKKWVRVPRPP